MMGHDPLPPLDSIISYTRPERYLLHPLFLHQRVPSVPSAPASVPLGAGSCVLLLAEEEPPGLWCLPTGRARRQDRSCHSALMATSRDGGCSQSLRQRPLKNVGCSLTDLVWGQCRFKRSRPWCAQTVRVKPAWGLCADPAQSKHGRAFGDCWALRLAAAGCPGDKSPRIPQCLLQSG